MRGRLTAIAALLVLAAGCGQGSQRLRIQDPFLQAPPKCVAVMPLENLSLTSLAGLGFGEILAGELERAGPFVVMEPGIYRTVAGELDMGAFDATNPDMRQLFHDRLGLEAVVVGTLTEYWYTDDPEVYRDKQPSVALNVRMISLPEGKELWSATITRTPGSMGSRLVMISEVAATVAADLTDDLMEALATGDEVAGSAFSAACRYEELLVAGAPGAGSAGGGGGSPVSVVKPASGGGPELGAEAQRLRERLQRGESFVLRGVDFPMREANFEGDPGEALAPLGELLQAYPDLVVQIVAHTDNQGAPDELRNLTNRQAAAVKEALVQNHGAGAAQVVAEGRGGDEPLLPNINRRNRQINRRVELSLMTPPAGGW